MTAVETTNGREKGRAVPPLPQFTFPDSGITVGLRRISPNSQALIAAALAKDAEWHRLNPKPEPPMQEVEAIDGTMSAPNVEAPEYLQASARYMALFAVEVATRLLELVIRQIEVVVDHDAVARQREDMAAIGAPLPDDADDREIYLKQICISSMRDSAELLAYAQGVSVPTREEIQASLDMFRRAVSP